MRRGTEKFLGKAFVCWWLLILVVIAIGGNAFLAPKAIQSGSALAFLMFCCFFAGAAVAAYRTYNSIDEIRGIFRD